MDPIWLVISALAVTLCTVAAVMLYMRPRGEELDHGHQEGGVIKDDDGNPHSL